MMQLGYDEVARICLSHSFSIQRLEDYVGKRDITKEQQEELKREMVYDDYSGLRQPGSSIFRKHTEAMKN